MGLEEFLSLEDEITAKRILIQLPAGLMPFADEIRRTLPTGCELRYFGRPSGSTEDFHRDGKGAEVLPEAFKGKKGVF